MDPEAVEPGGSRRREVERMFLEQGWDNIDDIDDWDGEDLDALAEMLPPEQYEALLDQLAEGGEHGR